jgi:hypothetical protein
MKITERQRVLNKFKKGKGCWTWTACILQNGYGGVRLKGKLMRAHRVVYELLVGKIPDGLQLDHLCRNRKCVNPAHLEPVTQKENMRRGNGACAINARKTHCKSGHEFTKENTRRRCRICHNKAHSLRYRRSVASKLLPMRDN